MCKYRRRHIPNSLETLFVDHWRLLASDLPAYEPEYRFAQHVILPTGKPWGVRFDFAWPDYLAAVEVEGGHYVQGRHQRPEGFEDDCRKYNQAILDSWRVLRFTGDMLKNDPIGCVNQVRQLLTARA